MQHIRRENLDTQEPFHRHYDHAAVAADDVQPIFKFARRCRVKRVSLINPTGIAEDAVNFVNVRVSNGATIIANWSTETGQQGTIAADISVDLVLAADSNDTVFQAGETMALDVDTTGTGSLPEGHIDVEGVYF